MGRLRASEGSRLSPVLLLMPISHPAWGDSGLNCARSTRLSITSNPWKAVLLGWERLLLHRARRWPWGASALPEFEPGLPPCYPRLADREERGRPRRRQVSTWAAAGVN